MKNLLVIKKTSQLNSVLTSHGYGLKTVLLKWQDSDSNITQVAVGFLEEGCSIDKHIHPDMEEFYFILKGSVSFEVENQNYSLEKDDFIKIPAGAEHSLNALKNTEMIYWGCQFSDK